MLLILSNSPLFFDVSDFPLYPPFCERLAFFGPSILHVKLLMLFASERPSFSPLDVQQPKTHRSPVPHRYSGDTITIHPCNKYLTWFLQAFNRENHIWDWEYLVGWGEGGRVGSWKNSRQSVYFYFLFSMWIACTSQYHSIHAAAKTTYALASFPGPRGILLHLQWLSTFFTPNCPQSRGLGRAQQQCQQLLSFWISVSGMEGFRVQNCGYFAPHLLPSAGGRR